MTKSFMNIPCIHFKQGEYKLVLFAEKVKNLWQILSINRREEDKDKGYQRILSAARVKKIKKYINENNPIPISLLVTFDRSELKKKSGNFYTLKIPVSNDSGWIIDGQHRLAGAHESDKNIILPVVAILDLDLTGQISQFITINREARGVPTALYYDLLKNIPITNPKQAADEIAADMARNLKLNEESVFHSRIVSTTSPKKGQISTTTFVRKISPLVIEDKGQLSEYLFTEKVGIIENYYRSLKNVYPKIFNNQDSIFFKTIGFGALMNVLPKILNTSIATYGGFKVEHVTKIFNEVSDFNFDQWLKMGSGNKAETEAANDFKARLEDTLENTDRKSIIL